MVCECNTVVNEILCFIQQKYNTLDEQSLLMLCENTFEEKIVEEARDLLLSYCPQGSCVTLRKGEGRKRRNIADIIRLLREVDPDSIPRFSAVNLSVLPPVTFDYVDVSSLLKSINLLQFEVSKLKVTQTESALVIEKTRDSVSGLEDKIQKLEAETAKSAKFSPVQLPFAESVQRAGKGRRRVKSSVAVAETQAERVERLTTTGESGASWAAIACGQADRGGKEVQCSIGEVNQLVVDGGALSQGFEKAPVSDGKEKRTPRPPSNKLQIVGSGQSLTLRPSERYTYFSVSRLHPDTSTEDLKSHLRGVGVASFVVFQLKTRTGEFSSFKVGVPGSASIEFSDPTLWPTGVYVRQWEKFNRSNLPAVK